MSSETPVIDLPTYPLDVFTTTSSLYDLEWRWVPCLPNYLRGTFAPLLTLKNNIIQNPFEFDNTGNTRNIRNRRNGHISWTKDEEDYLLRYVAVYGFKNWTDAARELNACFHNTREERLGKHCREKWHNYLNPNLKKGKWTKYEDRLLLNLQLKHGNKWSKISKKLKGRTENSVKNRWFSLIKQASKR